MNSEFCMNCGTKAYFGATKPKFCPDCGEPFNQGGVAHGAEQEPVNPQRINKHNF